MIFVFVLCVLLTTVNGKHPFQPNFLNRPALTPRTGIKIDDPLYVTPMLRDGNFGLARELSRVALEGPSVPESYSAFITVNEGLNSNLFFWFFPATVPGIRKTHPLILWLQGGPGGSSLYGLFVENGPFSVTKNLTLVPRKYPWTESFSVLYVDNPVGTGFSHTDFDAAYAENEEDVATDLYEFLTQFFIMFPELKQTDFYIAGESYAGKYIPAIGNYIHDRNGKDVKINLKGIAIGDGYCDPVSMLDYSDYLYEIGLIDSNAAHYMKQKQYDVEKLINQGRPIDYINAAKEWGEVISGNETNPSFFRKTTGFRNHFNYLLPEEDASEGLYEKYVNLAEVRQSLHVGDIPYSNGSVVAEHLLGDMLKSVKPWVINILNAGYKVLFYSGQLDIIVAYPLTENFLHSLDEWKLIKNYTEANRSIWRVDQQIAGYVKTVGNFNEVLVRNAGHMVPKDQPKWAFDLIHRFIAGKSFS